MEDHLGATTVPDPFDASETPTLAGLPAVERSVTRHDGILYCLIETASEQRRLGVLAASSAHVGRFEGELHPYGENSLLVGPLNAHNAAALRHSLPWLRPTLLGLRTSVGLGDRLGLATPGHLRAVQAAGGHLAPIPAQQSIREMERTGRGPQEVMDDALWGVFAEGWREPFGADADHLKTTADIDRCLAAGYTFFTFDPGEHVAGHADAAPLSTLRDAFEGLPWAQLDDTPAALDRRYLSRPFACEEHNISFDEATLMRAAVKYGRALAHVTMLYRHLAMAGAGQAWEVEVSVDETETPTTHAEHVYIATELRRLGVDWVSLAPRYIGRFEKGVDYIGDLATFEADFAVHAAIARVLGPYKLSLHSGSDKFSVYEPSARLTRGLVHLKTAGTSYLEALRTIATVDPTLLREIDHFAREHYEEDRASYHVSAHLDRAPASENLSDAALPTLLEQFDAREILHVTFGSVLTARSSDGGWRFYDRIMDALRTHDARYTADLEAHFTRHLRPFDGWAEQASGAVGTRIRSHGEV